MPADVFPAAEASWACSCGCEVTTCGSWTMLGGAEELGEDCSVSRTFPVPDPHTHLQISFDFYKIDSWDNGDNAYLYVDSVEEWSLGNQQEVGTHTCGGNYGSTFWVDEEFSVSLTVPHTGTTVHLLFESDLDEPDDNEAWGINNIMVLPTSPWHVQ